MATTLPGAVKDLLQDATATAVLATLDQHGFPHAVAGAHLHADQEGNLLYLEYLESSATNKNLVRSIWYDRKVAVALGAPDGRSFQIKGIPVRVHITGPVFLEHYQAVRRARGDVNLAAVWVIEPQEIRDENLAVLRRAEETGHPFFTHLDRLVR